MSYVNKKGDVPLTEGQIHRAFVGILGISERGADRTIVEITGNTEEALSEYIWDHWMGEPDEVSEAMVLKEVRRFR